MLFLLVMLGFVAILPVGACSNRGSRVFHQADGSDRALRPNDENIVKVSDLNIGIISYWSPSSADWDGIPPNSLVLINPQNGILELKSNNVVSDAPKWVALVERLKKKKVMVLGYVPTGYFDHVSCKDKPDCPTEARMRREVETYYKLMPSLDGIFYDETSPKEEDEAKADYDKEYDLLRSINNQKRITVFNVGWSSAKAVEATKAGEHLVLYESSPYEYHESGKQITEMTQKARKKGIIVWHLLHSVCSKEDMCSYVAKMAERGADYGFVTNIPEGDVTWNSIPSYWKEELAAFSAPDKQCAKK